MKKFFYSAAAQILFFTNMLKRDQKEALVGKISGEVKDSKSIVFVDFQGLEVNKMNDLRKQLKDSSIFFKVLKKTLMTVALEKAGLKKGMKEVSGELAIAIGKDEVEAAKILAKFSKENEGLKIVSGFLESKELAFEEVMNLAKLPAKEELLAKLVGTLNAPISGFVNALAGNIRGLVNVLKAVADTKQ